MVVVSTGEDYSPCIRKELEPVCKIHGGKMGLHAEGCQTVHVLSDVRAERARQFARYGSNSDLEDGTGPDVEWLGELSPVQDSVFSAADIEHHVRKLYEKYEADNGKPTWRHLVLEEVAESFTESSPVRLREELLQVAALAVSWIEKLDARIPEWADVPEGESPQVGDVAFKKGTELDGREVTIVQDDWFWFHLLTSESGPYPVEDYRFRRRVK